jgi:hypothetical protein
MTSRGNTIGMGVCLASVLATLSLWVVSYWWIVYVPAPRGPCMEVGEGAIALWLCGVPRTGPLPKECAGLKTGALHPYDDDGGVTFGTGFLIHKFQGLRTSWVPRVVLNAWPRIGFFVLPLWIPFIAFCAVFAWFYRARRIRVMRRRTGRCIDCGYDLRGLTEARCPECGKEFNSQVLATGRENAHNEQ